MTNHGCADEAAVLLLIPRTPHIEPCIITIMSCPGLPVGRVHGRGYNNIDVACAARARCRGI